MKYLYVLVSNESDFYYEQVLLSALSLREYNPCAFIVMLVDKDTANNLVGNRKKILEIIDELKVVDLGHLKDNKIKSRWLKTAMREYIDGDFLYIDCDTIITQALSIPENWTFDIGAVKHLHYSSLKNSPNYYSFTHNLEKCGIKYKSDDYFNGGVLFVRDTEKSKQFFALWHHLYKSYWTQYGISVDQLSLYDANEKFGGIITELPGEWNWQIGFGLNNFVDAKIMHTLTTAYIESDRELNAVHFLQRRTLYEDMKHKEKGIDDLIQIIHSAKSLFDENVKITPLSFNAEIIKKSIKSFSTNYKYVFLLGETGFDQIMISLIRELNINISGILMIKNTNINQMLNIPVYQLNNFPFSKAETGLIVPVRFPFVEESLLTLYNELFLNVYLLQ